MSIDDRKQGGQASLWGIPLWAWGAGVALGLVIGMLLFDGPVALIFAFSIGTAFAIAFAGDKRARRTGDRGGSTGAGTRGD